MKPFNAIHLACAQAVAIGMLLSASLPAKEVFTWTDEDGVVHFSDRPAEKTSSTTIDVEEVYKPGTAELTQPAPENDALELSAAQQRREEIARNSAAQREQRIQTEQLCARHQQRLTRMEPARRVYYTDTSGESVRMDDDQRMGLINESKDFINKNCR